MLAIAHADEIFKRYDNEDKDRPEVKRLPTQKYESKEHKSSVRARDTAWLAANLPEAFANNRSFLEEDATKILQIGGSRLASFHEKGHLVGCEEGLAPEPTAMEKCSVTRTHRLGRICLTNRKKCSNMQCFAIPFASRSKNGPKCEL